MTQKITVRRARSRIMVAAAAGLTVSLAFPPSPDVAERAEISPGAIASTSGVFAPSVAPGGVAIAPAAVQAASGVIAPRITAGAAEISPTAIESTSGVRAPRISLVTATAEIMPDAIAPTSGVLAPSVAAGMVEVSPVAISVGSGVIAPAVAPQSVQIAPTAIASSSGVLAPTVSSGESVIAPATIPATSGVIAPSVSAQSVSIAPPSIAATSGVFAPAVQAGAVNISPPAIASTSGVRAPVVSVPAPALFTDDFNRADQTLGTSPNWNRSGGSAGVATIRDGMVQFSGSGEPDTLYFAPDTGTTSHVAQIQNKIASGISLNGFPLVVCAIDENNFIGIRPRTNSWQALQRVNGAFTTLTSGGTINVDDVWRAEISGGQLRFLRNGVVSLGPFTVPAALQAATRAGLVVRADSRNPVFDNWQSGAAT